MWANRTPQEPRNAIVFAPSTATRHGSSAVGINKRVFILIMARTTQRAPGAGGGCLAQPSDASEPEPALCARRSLCTLQWKAGPSGSCRRSKCEAMWRSIDAALGGFELDRGQEIQRGSNRLLRTVDGTGDAGLADWRQGPWRKPPICDPLGSVNREL